MKHAPFPGYEDSITVAASDRSYGNIRFPFWSDDAKTLERVKRFAADQGVATDKVWGMSIANGGRGSNVTVTLGDKEMALGRYPDHKIEADAVVLTKKDVGVLLPIADCMPVVLYDPKHSIAVLGHFGWHTVGLLFGQSLITYLGNEFTSRPEDILVFVGPHIHKENYVFEQPVQLQDARWRDYLHKTDDGYQVDFASYLLSQFKEAGIRSDNIDVSPINTATSSDYYSNHIATQSGQESSRFGMLVMLR